MKKNKNQSGFLTRIKAGKYYEAVEAGFWRIWKNKAIWFWGIFISTGTAFSFGQGETKTETLPKETVSNFLTEYWRWVLLAIAVILILSIIIWLISAVARAGVIEELNKKQNNKRHILGFKKIWRVGENKFKKILKLDLVILGAVFLVISVFLITIIPLFLYENKIFFGIFFGISILVGFLFLVGMTILKPFAQIILLLGNLSIKDSFLRSWKLIRSNFKEFFKLCLTCFVLGLIKGFLLMLGLISMSILGLFFYLLFLRFDLGLSTEVIFLFGSIILVILFLVIVFVSSAFFALWKMDLLIWWVKLIDGVKSEEKVVKKIEDKKVAVNSEKVTAGANA